MLTRQAHFRAAVHYAAAPEEVYAALATPGGATGWWSTRGGRGRGVREVVSMLTDRASFRAEVQYAAAPERVYAALAAPGGATGWWSTRGATVTATGDRLRLDWSDADFVEFQVEVAERPTAMRWRCIAQHDRNLPEVDEWVGTVLTFQITPSDGGSLLQFEHEGLVPALECYGACERGWDFFLRRSVRQLIATGSGLPYHPA